MKYYWLTNSIDKKEIGYYPQCDSPKSLGNIKDLDYSKSIKELDPPEPIINERAKPTTFLFGGDISPARFLIFKNDFIEFLKDYDIESFKTWKLIVHHKMKVLTDYSLFYIPQPENDVFINFEKSDFYIGDFKDWRQPIIGSIKIKNYQEYLYQLDNLIKKNQIIKCNKLIVNLKNAKDDLFRTARFPLVGGFYISERLKLAIENKGFTGMKFKELTEVDKRIEVFY